MDALFQGVGFIYEDFVLHDIGMRDASRVKFLGPQFRILASEANLEDAGHGWVADDIDVTFHGGTS